MGRKGKREYQKFTSNDDVEFDLIRWRIEVWIESTKIEWKASLCVINFHFLPVPAAWFIPQSIYISQSLHSVPFYPSSSFQMVIEKRIKQFFGIYFHLKYLHNLFSYSHHFFFIIFFFLVKRVYLGPKSSPLEWTSFACIRIYPSWVRQIENYTNSTLLQTTPGIFHHVSNA